MALNSPVDRFRSAAEAMTPARMLVLLYERLQRDLLDAEEALTSSDRYRAHRALLHAQEIVTELDAALDTEAWSDGVQMSSIYRFLTGRLVAANVGQDLGAVRDCRAVVDPLVETWRQAWQQAAAGAVPARSEVANRMPLDVTG